MKHQQESARRTRLLRECEVRLTPALLLGAACAVLLLAAVLEGEEATNPSTAVALSVRDDATAAANKP